MGFWWTHLIIAFVSLIFAVQMFRGKHNKVGCLGVVLTVLNIVLAIIFKH